MRSITKGKSIRASLYALVVVSIVIGAAGLLYSNPTSAFARGDIEHREVPDDENPSGTGGSGPAGDSSGGPEIFDDEVDECDGGDESCRHTDIDIEIGPYCGDGILNGNEECDGVNTGDLTCSLLDPFDGGTLGCTETCTLDTSQCTSLTIEYAAYCGDGNVNQEWESCDSTAGCTEQCQWEEPQECSDLILAQVITSDDDVQNINGGNMTSNVYLGSDSNVIPPNVWFPLYWNGVYFTDPDIAGYEDVPGLAVERLENSIRAVMHGSRRGTEHIKGKIAFFRATVNDVQSDNDNGLGASNILERGFDGIMEVLPGQDEVWISHDYLHAGFWLTTTRQDDGFYTNWNMINYCSEDPLKIIAHKIICDEEIYLPNWGEAGVPDIIETTAQDFVDASQGHCWLQPDWEFQWGFGDKDSNDGVDKLNGAHIGPADGTDSTGECDTPFCGPNTSTGNAYGDWKTFSPTDNNGMTMVSIADLEEAPLLWVRENLQEGYIPFTYPPEGPTESNITAELYCHTDTMNFDNYDNIENPQPGETYYCVAFNSPIDDEPPVDVCPNIDGDQEAVPDGYHLDEGQCIEDDEPPVDVCPNIDGDQEAVPDGYHLDEGQCIEDDEPPVDVCPNIDGDQEAVPDGYHLDEGQCVKDSSNGGGGPVTTSGGGGGGGGGLPSLLVFNEKTVSVNIPDADLSWFTNISATCTVVYDTISHDKLGNAPDYNYAFTTGSTTSNGTFHTTTLHNLQTGNKYFWRPVCKAGALNALGQELNFATIETPEVLGFTTEDEPAPVDDPIVLGFEFLPETGGNFNDYYAIVTLTFMLFTTGLYLGYRRSSRDLA